MAKWINIESSGSLPGLTGIKVRESEIDAVGIRHGNVVVYWRGLGDWVVAHDSRNEPITEFADLMRALDIEDSD